MYATDTPGSQAKVVVFQYNPDQMRRTLAARTPPAQSGNVGGAREDVLRVLGAPVETITLSVVLDAVDQLAEGQGGQVVKEDGLHPALATLELLLYPATERVRESRELAEQGAVQLSPANVPLVLLVWGRSRVVPVQLTSFTVVEEAFDPALNPIQAKVDLGLRVLTNLELRPESLGYNAFLTYHTRKETLADKDAPRPGEDRVRGLLPA